MRVPRPAPWDMTISRASGDTNAAQGRDYGGERYKVC